MAKRTFMAFEIEEIESQIRPSKLAPTTMAALPQGNPLLSHISSMEKILKNAPYPYDYR